MPRRMHPRAGRLAAGLLVLAGAATTSPAPAVASPPAAVTIVATVDAGPGFAGSWSATGAIEDGGRFERSDLHLSGSLEHSPAAGALQVELEFTGAGGTFVLRDELLISGDGLDGTWQVVAGSGAYSTATGHGTSSFDPATASTTFAGVVDLTRH
ncbi:MAG TPA: hypothetical protein VFJ85_02015 [Acidimicrobiales bacterium]|nr:hypothetical protein [Acidimicrobiales bacterium]